MMKFVSGFVHRAIQDESGATAIEYGLIVTILSLAVIASLTTIGGQMNTAYTTVGGALTTGNH